MKYYSIVYPDKDNSTVYEYFSEVDVIDYYWEFWYERMVGADKRHLINVDNCIDDWVVVNWACEVSKEEYLKNRKGRIEHGV